MERAVHGVEDIIGYTFDDGLLVWEAISAAGSSIRRFPDGNKRLAVLGDTVLQLALAGDWYESGEPRVIFDRIRQEVGSNTKLNMVGMANKLDAFVNLAPGQYTISPITMAATVEAIIGAVYLDSKNMHAVKAVIQTLGLTPSSSG